VNVNDVYDLIEEIKKEMEYEIEEWKLKFIT
jgi:hypothetical protein